VGTRVSAILLGDPARRDCRVPWAPVHALRDLDDAPEYRRGMPREWDAATYDTLPLPHERWGRRTLDRLVLTGSETVLDAGCGTGRDTAALLDALPSGRVVAVDASAAMLAALRERLAAYGPDRLDRVEVVRADLAKPLALTSPTPVDAVFSVAAFHWIPDHLALFRNLAAVLRPGGQLVFECGGAGNLAAVHRAIETVLDDLPDVWNFAGTDTTAARLEAAGFTDAEVALMPDPARFDDPETLHRHLETVVLGAHLDRLHADERAAFVRAVADHLPEPVVDYVRLTVTARTFRPSGLLLTP
jgi:trans-aconitate 2-methyltransferase